MRYFYLGHDESNAALLKLTHFKSIHEASAHNYDWLSPAAQRTLLAT